VQSGSLAMAVSAGFTILAFSRHSTILNERGTSDRRYRVMILLKMEIHIQTKILKNNNI
jgi:hypothetical protein